MQIDDVSPFNFKPAAVVVGVVLGRAPVELVEEHLDELEGLAEAAGAKVVGRSLQRRPAPDPRTFVGSGKVEALKALAEETGAAVLLFDDDLSPSQVKAIEEATGRAVVDRSGLILEIFHQRARTREARTQVELARFRYLLPRLTRQWSHLSRQGGGVGMRGGEGEKQLEADRRVLRQRIRRLERQLETIERTRSLQRRRRREVPEIALAGYTNAGKSTLFNRLTGDATLVRDQLFATLDARLRRGHLPAVDGVPERQVVFVDTVGFIRKLPHHLVASFRSTLEEVAIADVVLHVVDRSHPHWGDQQAVGDAVLRELGVAPEKVVVVFNKLDRWGATRDDLSGLAVADGNGSVRVSAATGAGLDALRHEISRRLGDGAVTLLPPPSPELVGLAAAQPR